MAETNTIAKDCKAPPILGKDNLYNNWKGEVKIWKALVSLTEEKKAPTIFMTLTGKAKEAMLNMEINEMADENGVKSQEFLIRCV